jgi:uncharacterized protein (UPF0335 family)
MKLLKKYVFIGIYLCLLVAFGFGVYALHTQVVSFSGKIRDSQAKAKSLQENRQVLDMYKKILVQGSKEQQDIERYLLSSKKIFVAVSQIEKDAKEAGLVSKEMGGIVSVTSRESADLAKYDAKEFVVSLHVDQDSRVVDRYIEALTSLPYVSHVERVDMVFNNKDKTTAADITLVLIESK